MVDFANLPKHLEDETRQRELLDIERKLKDHAFPPQLVIENTSICNLTCIHCSHRELIRKKRHMERPLWNKIAEEVGQESPNTEIWPTFYGEALIMGYKNELWERLEYADKVGCKNLVLNSNGTLLDRWDNIDRILNSPLKRFISTACQKTRSSSFARRRSGKRSIRRSSGFAPSASGADRSTRSSSPSSL